MNTRYVALSMSWSKQRAASYDAIATLMTATQHAAAGRRVLSWRQGLYGAALTGVGAAGYETGPGHGEAGHYPQLLARKRPSDKPRTGGGEANVLMSTLDTAYLDSLAARIRAVGTAARRSDKG